MPRHLFQPLEIITFDSDYIDCPLKNNTYFELVFVSSGSGYRIVDGHQLSFATGYFFLHLPQEANAIQLQERSLLHFIKFHRVVFNADQAIFMGAFFQDWFRRMEFILHSEQSKIENLIVDLEDGRLIKALINLLIEESAGKKLCFDQNVKACLFMLLNITARNILKRSWTGEADFQHDEVKKDIITYINYHIFEPEKISLTSLAEHFAISASYFSEYFKTRYGMPLKKYILEYKLRLVESRLKHTTLSLTEIASGLQFTDTSHMNRMFKKYRGIFPRDLRETCLKEA
jgi:AraC-like DNA-binding protein